MGELSTKDTNNFTFSAWIYPQGNGGLENPATLIKIGTVGSSRPYYNIQLKSSRGLLVRFFDGYDPTSDQADITTMDAETRYYVTITYNYATQEMSYYVDGVLQATNWISNPIPGVKDHFII
jgi:hypothetical protein